MDPETSGKTSIYCFKISSAGQTISKTRNILRCFFRDKSQQNMHRGLVICLKKNIKFVNRYTGVFTNQENLKVHY